MPAYVWAYFPLPRSHPPTHTLKSAAAELRALLVARLTAAAGAPVAEGDNWDVFDFCNQFLQRADLLAEATHELVTRLVREHNVRLVEVRFCPALHTAGGLTAAEATAAVVQGFAAAEATVAAAEAAGDLAAGAPAGVPSPPSLPSLPLRGGVIVCALRSHTVEAMVAVAEVAGAFQGRGVIGFDVAGCEGAFPLARCRPALDAATRLGLPVTVHAGEWPGTTDNVRYALAELPGLRRLGHA